MEITDLTDRSSAAGHPPAHGAPPAPAPRRRRFGFLIFLLLIALLAGGAVALYPDLLKLGRVEEERGALLYQVARNPLQITVTAEGSVESASNVEVKCRVAGGSTILWIVEDGKIVEEGEEMVRLDTSAIDDKLNAQRITYEKALATVIQSQEGLEAAKIAVQEYEEGTFIESLKLAEAGIQIANENMRSAENQLKYSKRMVRKGFVSSLQCEADEFAVERAKLDLDAANTRKKVLVDFTKQKTLKDLVAKREASAAQLRSDQAALQLEKARLDRLQDQLKACVITAPKRGMVVYANNDSGGRFGSSGPQAQVEEGAIIRESQALVRLPDLSNMRVKVSIHESRVDQVKPGMPARVFIQDQEYEGKVLSIANQPQPGSWYSAKVKEYATAVSVEGATNLRPGMTAKVIILVADLKDALTLPVSSVVEQRGAFFCWVKTPEGHQRRPLKLGQTNDKLIEVVDGVKEGDEVFRNPRAMVEEARQEGPFEKRIEDGKFKAGEPAEEGQKAVAEAKGGEKPRAADPAAAGPAREAKPADASAGAGGAGAPSMSTAGSKGPREGPPGEPGKRSGTKASFDIMQFDKDGDRKVSRDELPEQMQQRFERMDMDKDGFITPGDIAEMKKRAAARAAAGGGGPGGDGPRGPGSDGPRGTGGEGVPRPASGSDEGRPAGGSGR